MFAQDYIHPSNASIDNEASQSIFNVHTKIFWLDTHVDG